MNLSRFFGSTNREALRQVRLALGPDALIVSNKRVNGGVEILASDPTALASADGQSSIAPPAGSVMDAIGALRGAVETRFDELLWGSQLRRAPQAAQLFQALLGLGFSTALLRAMLQRLPPDLSWSAAMQWVRGELTAHLPVLSGEDELWSPGRILALVGPTGVGKTTTLAKLAARVVKRQGPGSLILLTTDTYRIGAHEQLKIYGDMMRVPVHVVRDAAELRRLVASAGLRQTILIDNMGISQRDRHVAEQAAMLADAGRPVSRLLVLNASSHGDTLDEVARIYSADGAGLQGCIVTKTDEASRLAPALDTAIRYRLPIHYVSNGQQVPEDLLLQPAAELVDQALMHQHSTRDLYAPTEADFAVLMDMARAPDTEKQAQTAEQRRKRLLPRLFPGGAHGAGPLALEDLQGACASLDAAAACAQGFDLWTSWADAAGDPDVEPAVRHLIRGAMDRHARSGCAQALALHGHVRLEASQGVYGRFRGAMLFDGDMTAMAAPVQQWAFADGWQSSWGDTALMAPRPEEALLRQILWLERARQTMPLVHMIEGASPALMLKLSSLGLAWLAQCAGATRVVSDSCPTHLAALANSLVFRPAQVPDGSFPRAMLPAGAALWVAHGPVQLPRRHGSGPDAQAVVLRVAGRDDGAVATTLYGLGGVDSSDISPDVSAAWLLGQFQARPLWRHVGHAWRLLAQTGPRDAAIGRRALMAAQLGLAAWQAGDRAELAPVLAALGAKPSCATLPPALLKLFALKEMLG